MNYILKGNFEMNHNTISKTGQEKKWLWYFHGSAASKFKAWDGKEHDINILILANDEKDARERYDECIQRNNLLPLDDPQFCEFVGADQMVNDYFTPEMIEELEEKHSVPY